jgi:hypothetical protein
MSPRKQNVIFIENFFDLTKFLLCMDRTGSIFRAVATAEIGAMMRDIDFIEICFTIRTGLVRCSVTDSGRATNDAVSKTTQSTSFLCEEIHEIAPISLLLKQTVNIATTEA